jgi:peptidoglycan/xylan/chitin deacetylase (PgdA/CDA1 family)
MRGVTGLLKRIAAHAGHLPFLRQTARWTAPLEGHRANLVRVLTYHRIGAPPEFARQMAYLAANYHVVSMAELLAACRGDGRLPARSLLITFDDAYRNFAEHAWPVLKRHSLPVTLFVPTAFPDHPDRIFWWDRLKHALNQTARRETLPTPMGPVALATAGQRRQAFKQLRRYLVSLAHVQAMRCVDDICHELDVPPPPSEVLGWRELRQLARDGVTMGAHTRHHPFLHRITPEEAEAEVAGSLADLERQVGPVLPVFAYPGGYYNETVVAAVRRAGIDLAFTTVRGANDLQWADPLRLRRNNVGEQANLPVLQARLLHSSLYLNRWRPLDGAGGHEVEPKPKKITGDKVTHENIDSECHRHPGHREIAGGTRRHLRL